MKLYQKGHPIFSAFANGFCRVYRIFIGCAESISIRTAPPQLPVYEQPICPDEGYIWVPGYWAYGPTDISGSPDLGARPEAGLLWTPGYWAGQNGYYIWH